MNRFRFVRLLLAAVLSVICLNSAKSQIPVTDIAAIIQLVIQVEKLETQILTAKEHLQNARDTLESMTGPRGMQDLLGGVVRNYLPADINQLMAVMEDTSTLYGELAAAFQETMRRNAVLSDEVLAGMSESQRLLVTDQRRAAASLESLTQQALSATSARFESLQSLIDAIGSASDQKSILELQARVQAETAMLQNEATKLNTLYQTSAARSALRTQRLREQSIVEVGNLRNLPPMGLVP